MACIERVQTSAHACLHLVQMGHGVGCSKSASKARPFLLHFKLPETRRKKTQALMGATRLASG